MRAPLGTYTPWSLRWGYEGAQEELVDFRGTFVPLSWSETQRGDRGDPRPSVQALYQSLGAYMERVRAATRELVRDGYLLPEDAALAVEMARERWDWVQALEAGG